MFMCCMCFPLKFCGPVMAGASFPEPPVVSQRPPFCHTNTAALYVTGLQPPRSPPTTPPHPPCPQRPQLAPQQPAEPHGSVRCQPQSRPELRRAGQLRAWLRPTSSKLHLIAAGERQCGQRTFDQCGRAESVTAGTGAAPTFA